MKKVLSVSDGAHFPVAIADLALQMNNIDPILLNSISYYRPTALKPTNIFIMIML